MSDGRGLTDLSQGDTMDEGDLEKVTLRLPARHIRALDFLVQVDDFPSRSEAIRAAIRDFIYARLELVTDKVKKMEEAEKIMAEMEAMEERYLGK
ncbi:MAG: ribbon-helix-helix domain-containing protein [Methanomassiliicoccales archaeon]|nr:ribbon-helix-helix domain-containing protein [Methanomassiliicoccales archaeon]